jgi:hypothetical protein
VFAVREAFTIAGGFDGCAGVAAVDAASVDGAAETSAAAATGAALCADENTPDSINRLIAQSPATTQAADTTRTR